jgi:hypothetical protein
VGPAFETVLEHFSIYLGKGMTDRKKPGAAFWASVMVVVALVLYPLSIGPACWISSRTNVGSAAVSIAYQPLTWGVSPSRRVYDAFSWYSGIGSAEGWAWTNQDGWRWGEASGATWLYSPKAKAIFSATGSNE